MEQRIIVRWTFPALEMLAEIHDYIAEYSEISADKYVTELIDYTDRLEKHPESCAKCRNSKLGNQDYRCCNVRNHIIIYEYIEPKVNILAVIHSKRHPDSIDL